MKWKCSCDQSHINHSVWGQCCTNLGRLANGIIPSRGHTMNNFTSNWVIHLPIQSFPFTLLHIVYFKLNVPFSSFSFQIKWRWNKGPYPKKIAIPPSGYFGRFLSYIHSSFFARVIFLQCVKLWKVSDRLERLDLSDFTRVPPLNIRLRNSKLIKGKIQRGDPLKIWKIKFLQSIWNFSQLHTLQKYDHSQDFRSIAHLEVILITNNPT